MSISYELAYTRRELRQGKQGQYFQDKYGKLWQICQRDGRRRGHVLCLDVKNARIKSFGLHTLVFPAKVDASHVVTITHIGNPSPVFNPVIDAARAWRFLNDALDALEDDNDVDDV